MLLSLPIMRCILYKQTKTCYKKLIKKSQTRDKSMCPREKDCNQPRASMRHWKNFPTCGVERKERAKLTWYSGCSGCIWSWWSWPEDPHSCPLPPCKAQPNTITSHSSSLDQTQASEMFNFLTFGKNTASKGILIFQNTLLFTLKSQPAIHWSDHNTSLLH